MNVVIYSTEFEPITVLDLPLALLEKAINTGEVTLRIRGDNTPYGNKTCVLKPARLLTLKGDFMDVLTTTDETAAMFAKPGWLPGQQGQVNYFKDRIQHYKRKINGY